MKLTFNVLEKRKDDRDRHWPAYIGGRLRTSTLVLVLTFLALWWVYSENRPQEESHGGPPSTQVVPPGFVPDPNYTWVPRSKVQAPPTVTVTETPTPTPTPTPSTTPPPPPPPPPLIPPFVLPPPFGPPPSNTTPPPGPAPAPAPPSAPPPGGLTGYSDTHGYTGDP
jgi:hypothetical protein